MAEAHFDWEVKSTKISKKMIAAIWVLLCQIALLTKVHAESEITLPINVRAPSGTTISLMDAASGEVLQQKTASENKTIVFSITYNSPGNYAYVLEQQGTTANTINLDVAVFNCESQDGLEVAIVAKKEGAKIDEISFLPTDIPTSPSPAPSETSNPDVDTGVGIQYFVMNMTALFFSITTLYLIKYRKEKYE